MDAEKWMVTWKAKPELGDTPVDEGLITLSRTSENSPADVRQAAGNALPSCKIRVETYHWEFSSISRWSILRAILAG